MYDLQQLKALIAVKKAGSYTAAAETLGYSQPAVSYQIRQLQRDAGTRLVIPTGRGAKLTQAGQVLAQHAEAIFALIHAAEEGLAALTALSGAEVRIEAFQSICATLIPRALDSIREQGADLRLTLHQAEPAETRAKVRHGDADLGLLAQWDNEPSPEGEELMTRITLMSDRCCVVMRRDHRLADQAEIDFAELATESWVVESSRDRFASACRDTGFVPRIAAVTDDVVTTQTLVMSGLGITLVNELGLNAYLHAGLVARPLRNWPRRVIYALLWPNMARVPAVATVLAALRSAAGELQVASQGRTAAHPRPIPTVKLFMTVIH